jgi:NhaP-type Na+/H+ or K+/H+ antiporter
MEVGSFFLWALIPWYIADGLGMSGIVSIVAVGFFIDIYIAGPKDPNKKGPPKRPQLDYSRTDDYMNMEHPAQSASSFESGGRSIGPLPSTERLHLSSIADRHVRFVAHLTAQLAENAIFAYLGLFLFSNHYDWDPTLVSISILSCVVSRGFMVVVVSYVILHIYRCRGMGPGGSLSNSSKTAIAISDPRTQAVLVLAGLRGAVSLALVENVPIYNQGTGEGCEFKQLMKGMTSASILFTTFIFGGGAYYILPHLGITPDRSTSIDLDSRNDDKSDPLREDSNNKTMISELRIPDAVVV